MKGKISIKNEAVEGRITLDIEGVIGVPEQMQFEERGNRVSTFATLRELLDGLAEQAPRSITVNIRSTGGDVGDALLIYDYLKSCGAQVTTRCYGYAASAATIIAQAASDGRREISGNCLYLVHNSSCETEGNRQDIESAADMLRRTDERIAEIYSRTSGRPVADFARLMGENGGRGRWLSPKEAICYGLADSVIESGRIGRKERRLIQNLGLPALPFGYAFGETIRTAFENIREFMVGKSPLGTEPEISEKACSESPREEERDRATGKEDAGALMMVSTGTNEISGAEAGTGETRKKESAEEPKPEKEEKSTEASSIPGEEQAGKEQKHRIKTKEKKPDVKTKSTVNRAKAATVPLAKKTTAIEAVEEYPRKDILPSQTKPKEDPGVYGRRMSQNQEAYMEDLRKIKTV